jgi:hypothetical protein
MGKVEYRTPFVYIYMDSAGIDSLFAQTTERLETQVVTEKENALAGKVGLGAAFKALFFANANASAELSASGRKMEQVTATLSVEQKLAGLIRYLNRFENEKYFDEIQQAISQCSQQKMTVFVNIETEFDIPQFYWGKDYGVKTVNQEKIISFEISPSPLRPKDAPTNVVDVRGTLMPSYEDSYYSSDSYFKKQPFTYKSSKPRVLMSASPNKFTRITDSTMNTIGHDAMIWGGHNGKDVLLGVFGSLNGVGDNKYQIKPYAIWYK